MEEKNQYNSEVSHSYGLDVVKAKEIRNALFHSHMDLAKALLDKLHYADIADFINSMGKDKRAVVIGLLEAETIANILVELDSPILGEVIGMLGGETVATLISKLSLDDATYVLEEVPEHLRAGLLIHLSPEIRKAFMEEIQYPEDSAGRLMHKDMVVVQSSWKVIKVLDHIKNADHLPNNFHDIYVVDKKNHPIGFLKIPDLLRANLNSQVNEIMKPTNVKVETSVDQNEVQFIFKQYECSSVPVVNRDGRIIGIIEVGDIVEVIDDEVEEDIMRMGGLNEDDLHVNFLGTVKQRIPWLIVNLCLAFTSALVISRFHTTIEQLIAVASVMPLVASTSGNAGIQTATISVRALATKDLNSINAFRVVAKETLTNMTNGLVIALIGSTIISVFYQNYKLAGIFGLSIVTCFTLSGLFGATLPLLLHRIKVDPALASGIFLTAITDMLGFFTFLFLVTLLIL